MTIDGAAIVPGAPKLLFSRPARILAYDVTPDGQRFLFIAEDRYAERGTLSAILNWSPLSGLVVATSAR
jgi:hypothetical protein